jgi:hypothetical protein
MSSRSIPTRDGAIGRFFHLGHRGKRLMQVSFWLGILGAIQGVTSALRQWTAARFRID